MKMRLAKLLAPLLMLTAASAAQANPEIPKLTGPVVDLVDEIPADEEAKLDAELRDFQKRTGHQLQVLTVPDMGGYDAETYGKAVGDAWKIGRAGVDDGIILIHAVKERKIRIEVGQGAEAYLTDGMSGQIIRDDIVPRFKEKAFAEGIVEGSRSIMREAAITPEQRAEDERAARLESERSARAAKEAFLSFLSWVFGIGVAGGAGFVLYRGATRGKRARLKAEQEARDAALRLQREKQRAEERARQAKLDEERRERERLAALERERIRLEAERARQAMLDAMSPSERRAFLQKEEDERERKRREAQRAERERQRLAAIAAAEAAAAEERRREQRRDEEARRERERRDEPTVYYGGSSSSSSSSSSPSTPSWTGGGGDFGGGGSTGDY